MKKLIFLLLLMLATSLPCVAADLKVGHFDLQRLVSQSQAGKDARELYLKKAQAYQDEINQRTKALETLKEEVKGAAAGLKEGDAIPETVLAKDKEAAAQFRELQRLLGGYQDELKLYDTEMTRSVLLQFQPVLGAFAEKQKYDYLFKLGEGFAYAANQRDVTDELIKAFDKAIKK